MNFSEYKDVLVLLELSNGAPVGVSLENIAAAKAVAGDGKVVAVSFGCEDAAKTAISYGADCAIVAESEHFASGNADAFAVAAAKIAEEVKPAAIFVGATPSGKDLAPRIAGKLGTGAVTDAVGMKTGDDGHIVFTVPAFGGSILTDVVIDNSRPQVASLRGGSFTKNAPDESRTGEIVKKEISLADEALRYKVLEAVQEITESVNLEEADYIVSGGRGMGSAENFAKLQELADVVGGEVGCSRPVAESGWTTRARQVGQSGKIVAPKIYFAFGISGATQHVSAMIDSGYIIAINKDEEAPIFDIADVGIVGNAMDVLPLLVDAFRKMKS